MKVIEFIKVMRRYEYYGRLKVHEPKDTHYLSFIEADRDNFYELCKFLIRFGNHQELKSSYLYKKLVHYLIDSQRMNGHWMIEPTAWTGDGDVVSDLITTPTIMGMAAAYANKEFEGAKEAFEAAEKIFFGSTSRSGCRHCTCIGLDTARYFDFAGILRDYREHECMQLSFNNILEEVKSTRVSKNFDPAYTLEILYRMNPENDYVLQRSFSLSDKSKHKDYLIALIKKEITPELFKTYKLGDLLWLPFENSKIHEPVEILRIINKKEDYDITWIKLTKLYLRYLIEKTTGVELEEVEEDV
ncbi:MAG: hypothetical protein J7L47_10820 [Candidatus Odinarchaeota archaeon]|nr:hypothetical protein [Candidatus Odinarchaeota archaeon]